jgi:hypothetical protein
MFEPVPKHERVLTGCNLRPLQFLTAKAGLKLGFSLAKLRFLEVAGQAELVSPKLEVLGQPRFSEYTARLFSICGTNSTNLDFLIYLPIMKRMEGMTIEEMSKILSLPYKTVAQRILRGGYDPIFSGNLYSPEVLEAIRNVPDRGGALRKQSQGTPREHRLYGAFLERQEGLYGTCQDC